MYDFMRLVLFFDLPMVTKQDVRIYTHFRKYLIKNGYLMMQFSIYSKIFNNRDAVAKHIPILQREVPKNGQVRIATMTEKQFASIKILVGGISKQEETVTADPFIRL
jgi:CRISPR-associated protein Cas2